MLNIVIISGHLLKQKNQVGVHHLYNALRKNNSVEFLTIPLSFSRVCILGLQGKVTGVTFVHYLILSILQLKILTPWNGLLSNRVLRIVDYFFRLSHREVAIIKSSDIVIIDTCMALKFVAKIREMDLAKVIYRGSDLISFYKKNSLMEYYLQKACPYFDKASVVHEKIGTELSQKYSIPLSKIEYNPHGVNKLMMSGSLENPFISSKNAVFVGVSHIDEECLKVLASANPDWHFHCVGISRISIDNENISSYGIVNFNETLAYIKYCDLALAIRKPGYESEVFATSLKIQQYKFYKRPIIGPAAIFKNDKEIFSYVDSNSQSITNAFQSAIKHNVVEYDVEKILSWDDVAHRLIS